MTRRATNQPIEAPTPEHMAHGGIERRFVTHVETNTKAMAHISSHSPVERWIRAGRLSDSQVAAIALIRALWADCGLRQKLTASYDERISRGDNEWTAIRELQARKTLHKIQAQIIPWQWDAFENVCRWNETAGSTGTALGFRTSDQAQAATLMLVQCVADIIANHQGMT